MAIEPDGVAPYGTPAVVMEAIQRFRDRGLPTPLTDEVLQRAGLSNATSSSSRLLQSLRLLDLVDRNGNPSEQLRDLARAPSDEFQDRLAAVVRAAYAPIFQFVDPTHDGAERVRDAFRGNQPQAQQDRMAAFFLHLCRTAGIVEQAPETATRTPQRRDRTTSHQRPPARRSGGEMTQQAATRSHRFPPAIAGLLDALPGNLAWTKTERDRFLDTFTAVLDFSIEIVEYENQDARAAEDEVS